MLSEVDLTKINNVAITNNENIFLPWCPWFCAKFYCEVIYAIKQILLSTISVYEFVLHCWCFHRTNITKLITYMSLMPL